MPEIVTDGTTPQMPLPAAEETYGRQTNPGLGRFVLGTLQDAGTALLGRAAERGTVAGSSSFDQGMAGLTATGGAFDQPLISVPQPAPSPEMPPEQYNDLYAPRDTNGKVVSIGDKPMPEALAKIIGQQKAEAMQRESVLARYGETHSGITTFAVGSLASMLDPLNAGAAFLPAIGEGAVAARLGGGLLARTAARLAAGAEMGIAQQLPLSAIKFGLSPEEASDYGLRDAMRDLAYGAAGVAVLHTGIGSIGEILGRRAGAAAEPAGERPAVSASGVAATAEPSAPAPAPGTLTSAVRVDGKLYTGITHADAYDAALREHGGVDPGSSASDRNLFVTAEGQPLTFEEARAYRAGTAVLSADAVTKNAAMRGALGEISDGRPVDVAPIIGGNGAEAAPALARIDELTADRLAAERGGRAAGSPAQSFSAIAEQDRQGWAPSVARDELVAANDAVYGVKPEAEAAPRPEAGSDAELTAAEERAAQIPPESLHPEDQAALAASAQEVEKAGFMQKALETAAACIMGIV